MINIFTLYFSLVIVIIICLNNIIHIYSIDNTLVRNGKISSIVLDLPQWGHLTLKISQSFC